MPSRISTETKEVEETLGEWLAQCVSKNRNMVRFLLPKADAPPLYNNRDLIILARCALLANEWKGSEPQYKDLHKHFDRALRKDLNASAPPASSSTKLLARSSRRKLAA